MGQDSRQDQLREEKTSYFQSKTLKNSYTVSEFLFEHTKACGRFKLPLALTDSLELHIAQIVAKSRVLSGLAVVPRHSTPPNWQILLNYLFREKILVKPEFTFRDRANDLPSCYEVLLTPKFSPKSTDGADVSKRGNGYGASMHIEEAYSKAVGELLERYFLSIYKKASFIKASLGSLQKKGVRVLELSELNSFLPWQKALFPQFVWDPNSLFEWMSVIELTRGGKTYVPAQTIFWGYDFGTKNPEPTLTQPTSSGGAGHFSYEEAVLASIYENVQRDGFMMFWLNSIAPPVLDQNLGTHTELATLLGSIQQYGLKIFFLDTTTDISIPSCTCVLLDDRTDEPILSVGAASGFDTEKNFMTSAMEALSVRNTISNWKFSIPEDYKPFTSTQISRDERLLSWKGKAALERFAFFISGEKTSVETSRFGRASKKFSSTTEEYEYVLLLFREKGTGYEVYCHEVAHPVLKKLGYHVVKTLIPKLFRLYLTENMAALDAERLRTVSKKLGYEQTTLNPWPHPFP